MKTQRTNAKLLGVSVVAIAISLLGPTSDGQAANNQIECDGKAKNVKAITATGVALLPSLSLRTPAYSTQCHF